MTNIHLDVKSQLNNFILNKRIPNILFHGPSGSGKRTLVFDFINKIYKTNEEKKQYVFYVNCAHGKGIKFIREEVKFFAKMHINNFKGNKFKCIILCNADKLTIDAQSALRRCIELFSHNTRFFIIIEDKSKLLKPIVSRFSEIYIPYPIIKKKIENLHSLEIKYDNKKKLNFLKKHLTDLEKSCCFELSEKFYSKSINYLDFMDYILLNLKDNNYKYTLILVIQKVRKEFRDEKLLILFILNLLKFRYYHDLENILSF
tara:strand:- start:191 stop:967 length:777 start_codon:yes stop_codon:yes gene_type:complete